jgi:hypothetical protein
VVLFISLKFFQHLNEALVTDACTLCSLSSAVPSILHSTAPHRSFPSCVQRARPSSASAPVQQILVTERAVRGLAPVPPYAEARGGRESECRAPFLPTRRRARQNHASRRPCVAWPGNSCISAFSFGSGSAHGARMIWNARVAQAGRPADSCGFLG